MSYSVPFFKLPDGHASAGFADVQMRRNVLQAAWLWAQVKQSEHPANKPSEAKGMSRVAACLNETTNFS
jgi:hypothetical protein